MTEDLERAKGMMSDDYNTTINYRLNKRLLQQFWHAYVTMGKGQLAVDNATEKR
ncbi:hypothetical protein [Bacteroides salyersiae]|uniref:hypothetical protein n=1 Tax=Bacteroides salyersiae TaxID=291644 RepID=UPI00216559A2|nr:hypothetical protein [Bacteroides salyersiae]MCS3057450.1 hypothetical protein [Bacteroides salyersiae]